jgi:prepilin-type N-terminal cleavage/methylation domain-containing protein
MKQLGYGFTLLETLLSITIIAILMGTMISYLTPSYFQMMLVLRKIANEVQIARSMAIKSQRTIYYCSLESGAWEKERVIKDGANVIYHRFAPLFGHYTLQLRNSLASNECLLFSLLGFTRSEYATFLLSSSGKVMKMTITLSGRLRILPY